MKINYLDSLYHKKHTRASLIKELDGAMNAHTLKTRAFSCFCSPAFIARIQSYTSHDLSVKILSESSKEVQLYELSFKFQDDGVQETCRGYFYMLPAQGYDGVYTVLSCEESHFFNRGLLPFFLRNFPDSSLTFITHKKLQNLLSDFQRENKFAEFVISRASVRTRYEKYIVPSVTWPGFALEKAFSWASEQDGWFQSITVQAKEKFSQPINVTVWRHGIVSTDKALEKVFSSFLAPIEKTVHDNVVMFSQRSRRDVKNRDIRPLAINLPYNLFEDVKENKRFIGQMQKLSSASISVIHGNPYIHISVLDYWDGSAFDVWVLTADKIIIVPQLKGTMPAIKRLVNHIFDNYAEGDIENYEVLNHEC